MDISDAGATTSLDEDARTPASLDIAVVLAAGEGSRLWPLTTYQPKPMLRVGNRPVLEYVLDALWESGVARVVVVIGHGSHRVQNHFGDRHRSVELTYVTQETQLGSGHALEQAATELPEEFLVVNGDTVVDNRMIRETVRHYRETDSAACLAVATSGEPHGYDRVRTRGDEVTGIDEPNGVTSARINAGLYVFDRRVFDALERTPFRNGERPLPAALDRIGGRVVAAVPEGVWYDPSYPWELLSATEALLSGHPELNRDDAIDATARIHDSAVVEDHVRIGQGSDIRAGAVLGRGTCVDQNVRVGPNAVIERSILGPDVRVGANVLLRDTIVGSGARIGDGTVSPGRSATLVINGREHAGRRLGSIVADRAGVGANVTLEPGARVGAEATVGSGVTVCGDVRETAEVVR
ncbi:MAG: sugar phosphate nucleotidyltransferase [Natronomonas sp.]